MPACLSDINNNRALVTYGYNVRVLTIMNVDGNFSNGDCWGRSFSSCGVGKDTQDRGIRRKRGTRTLDRERISFRYKPKIKGEANRMR